VKWREIIANRTELKITMITRLILIAFAAATLLIGLSACHTAHGAGEDIESAGQKIQEHTP